MPGKVPQGRVGQRLPKQQADDQSLSTKRWSSSYQDQPYAGHGRPAVHSFAGHMRMRIIKAVLTALAFTILLQLSTDYPETWSHVQFAVPNCFFHCRPHPGRAIASSFLEVFQSYPPVLTVSPNGTLELTDGSSNASVGLINSDWPTCQETLAVHSFAFSYGKPFVGQYTPPECAFNRITWNLTVLSAGRQFDRLGIVYLGDIEVFRTSTAEPTRNGIEWTYLKDMTSFLFLLKDNQKLIFDLGNLVNDVYTASFNVTLTASYFTAKESVAPADLILPLSSRKSAQGQPSVFIVPPATASNSLLLPRNARKAVFTIAATGQNEEEFWWSNVLQSNIDTFPSYGALYGYSPFREAQLFIDGQLAGVAWPFPVIFTGGIVPGLWRPLVGIDSFDVQEDEIDISPWLPVLCDGREHNFTVRISGLIDDANNNAILSEMTGSYWLVTGKVFIWLDEAGHQTTGYSLHTIAPSPTFDISSTIVKSRNGTNQTLLYHVAAERKLSFTSLINTSHGIKVASWHQSLAFSNIGNFSNGANVEINEQYTRGYDVSSNGYARQYVYPLYAYSTYKSHRDNITIKGTIHRGKDVKIIGQSAFPTGLEPFSAAEALQARYPTYQGSWLSTTQSGNATYQANETARTSYSYGSTDQGMTFAGVRVDFLDDLYEFPPISVSDELFRRRVRAVNGTVIEDEELLVGSSVGHEHRQSYDEPEGFVLSSVPGRGSFDRDGPCEGGP